MGGQDANNAWHIKLFILYLVFITRCEHIDTFTQPHTLSYSLMILTHHQPKGEELKVIELRGIWSCELLVEKCATQTDIASNGE